MEDSQLSFVPPVLFDNAPVGHDFGDCLLQPPPLVYQGEVVKVRFVSGHPRNDLMLDQSFLAIEKHDLQTGTWNTILRDNDWDTEFQWIRTNVILGESEIEIRWFVPEYQERGLYRISHYGAHKTLLRGEIKHYSGTSEPFEITSPFLHKRQHQDMTPQKIHPNIFNEIRKLFSL